MSTHPKKKPERPSATDLAVSMGTGVTGAEVAAFLPDHYKPFAAIIAPFLTGGLNLLRFRHAERVVDTASSSLGTDAEGILRAIGDDPELLVLSQEVFEAASRTANQEKVDVLGRIWAHALGDDAKPDEDTMMLRAVADLETPHVQLLVWLAADDKVHSVDEMTAALPHLATVIRGVAGTLERVGFTNRGMVEEMVGYYFTALGFQITDWGRLAMDYLDVWAASVLDDQ